MLAHIEPFVVWIRVALIIVVGIPLLWYVSYIINNVLQERVHAHIRQLCIKTIWYGGLGLLVVTVLHDLGFKLSVILGAAGVVGIAVGFAARTTISNVISGIFLLLEQSFRIGDKVSCEGVVGIVDSIDLLSVKLRTFDNTLVRIPNETIIKNTMKNLTYFPYHRFTFHIRLSIVHDPHVFIDRVYNSIQSSTIILDDPKPVCMIKEQSVWYVTHEQAVFCNTIVVYVWALNDHITKVQKQVIESVSLLLKNESLDGIIEFVAE